MEGCNGSRGENRRQFLRTTAAVGAIATTTSAQSLLAADAKGIPTITLGKTGKTVSRLGMGTSWAVAPSFVQNALFAGVRYVDTSESYENGVSEKTVGEVIERTNLRKDVYLVTKCNGYDRARGSGIGKFLESHLNPSLERLRTDYVDAYYLHGAKGTSIPLLRDAETRAAFETLKKSGKIRFAGLSCHDARLAEVVEAAAEVGWIDQIMIQFNFRTMDREALARAVDKAAKANIGLVAMKTQGGAEPFKDAQSANSPKITAMVDKGFSVAQAAIKAVFADERFQVVVSEMTNRDQLRENSAATVVPITTKEARLLEEHREKTAKLYCHGCGHLCETAANGVPVATALRYLRYYESYGKREEARALYQALPVLSRQLVDADLNAAEAACPHGLPVASLIRRADRALS